MLEPANATTPRKTPARGFGLIEVMLSSVMLAVGMAASISTIRQLESSYAHERMVTQALNVCEQTMEGLLVRYADDAALAASGTHTGPTFDRLGKAGGTAFYSTEWVVNAGVPIADTRELIVTVRWVENGDNKQLALRTVRT